MIVDEKIEQYAAAHTTPVDPFFERLAAETREKMTAPQMMVGLLEGRFLEFLVRLSGARMVVELGTFTGWSSISMASGLPPGGPVDLVFIDADKHNYRNYYEAVLQKLGEDGLIVVDNVLWSGRVVEEGDDDESTRAIREINEHIRNDDRVVCVMLTVRDGMTLARKR